MDILIDGYNLLHESPFMGVDRQAGYMQRARERLLRAIGTHNVESKKITVVFDASASKYPAAEGNYFGLTIRFADDHDEADDLIEELIRKHSHPQSLTVVSSDHRIQTAAIRRNAKPIDSDLWIDRWQSQKPAKDSKDVAELPFENEKEKGLSEDEQKEWLDEFGFDI